jgi:hypothetical protein
MSVVRCLRSFIPQHRMARIETAKCRSRKRPVHRRCDSARQVSRRRITQTVATPPANLFQVTQTWKVVSSIPFGMAQKNHFLDPAPQSTLLINALSWVAFVRKQFGPEVDIAGASRWSTIVRTDGRSSPHAAPAGPLAVKCTALPVRRSSLFNWSCMQCYAFAKITVNAHSKAVKQMFVQATTR